MIIGKLRFVIKEVSSDLRKESLEIFMVTVIRFGLVYFVGFICGLLNLADIDEFLFELLNSFDELGGYIIVVS